MQLSKLYIAFTLLAGSMIPVFSLADVSGTVYREFPVNGAVANTYGVQDANEQGVAGIDVIVTGDNAATETVQTDANGNWTTTLGAGAFGSDVKVEFTNIPSYLHSSPVNTGSNTTVQFVSEGVTDVDLGLHNPADFSEENPLLAVTRLINGDQSTGTPAIEAQDYQRTNPIQNVVNANSGGGVGALWGLAYDKDKQVLFASAVLRRHVGLGSEGLDGIYVIDYSVGSGSGALLSPINLSSFGVDVGNDPRTVALPSSVTAPSHDENSYPLIGKVGIGDIDISDDGDTLYVMNLKDKELVLLDISDLNSVSLIGSPIAIPDPGCTNGEHRPWAIDIHDGEVYVGMVCDGTAGGTRDDLQLYVKRLSGVNFADVYDFTLNYDRTVDWWQTGQGAQTGGNGTGRWHIWENIWDTPSSPFKFWHGQAILGDIEFDVDGSLILLILNRNALRSGYNNYSEDIGDFTWYSGRNMGEVLRVCNVSDSYILEGGAGCAFNFTGEAHQNFNGGEFYMDNSPMVPDVNGHTEGHIGGGALLPGSGELVTATQTGFNSGGFNWYNNTTGAKVAQVPVYDLSTLGGMSKAAGIGDIELLSAPAPLEIGNRVWDDINSNGIQDAGEPAIQGVDVTLTCGGLTATSTSDANGMWLIQDGDMTGGVNIPRNTSCTVSVPLTEPNNGNGITTQLSDTATGNDADPATGSFAITTGRSGQNNHTYDIGYSSVPPSTSGCTTITNTATITGVTETDTNNTNDSSSIAIQANCTTATPQVDLSLVKTADKTQVLAGETLTYTLTLRNEGTADGTGIEVSDNLPAGVTHVSNNTSQGSYNSGTGIWTVGDLAIGATATLEIEVTVN